MSAFVDTSVLVAGFWGDHPYHGPSVKLLAGLQDSRPACSMHSLAEVYSTMTRLPVKPRIPPENVMLSLSHVQASFEVVSLESEDYIRVLRNAVEHGITGGRIHDALLLARGRRTQIRFTLGI